MLRMTTWQPCKDLVQGGQIPAPCYKSLTLRAATLSLHRFGTG